MSTNNVTLARPYAKAFFEHALAKDKLKEWSAVLSLWAFAVSESSTVRFINNPAAEEEQKIALFEGLMTESDLVGLTVSQEEQAALSAAIRLLAENKRLLLLPAIHLLFDERRAEQEKTLKVNVLSFSALDEKQQQALVQQLKKRLKRDIALNVSIDAALLGGAIIQAGDLVIDGSVRGELKKLRAQLVA